MTHKCKIATSFIICLVSIALSGCSVNPFRTDNEFTGTATGTGIGAGAGAVTALAAGASKAEIAMAGIAGGALGYYVTSLPFISGGVTHVSGKVYTLGNYVTIEIPSDQIFEVNSSEFVSQAPAVLDSAVSVLNRYPNNNIMISGNTNGFYTSKLERKLSQDRARQVAAYFWAHGINNFTDQNSNIADLKGDQTFVRKLTYVGYGSHFPISNNITVIGRRENDRIQITSFPSKEKLKMNKCGRVYTNIGRLNDTDDTSSSNINNEFKGDNVPEHSDNSDNFRGETWETYNN
jgi:outer membrane protein OmpA-like peptidoglycan-associated protein